MPFTFLKAQIFPSQKWNGFDTFECLDSNYVLVFSDEFNQSSIDTSKWHTHYPYGFPDDRTANGDQIYKDENIIVKDGHCILRAKYEEASHGNISSNQTSGMLHTKWEERKRFQYGIFEMRAKVPSGSGFWPAFWLYGWCANEIDIFELSDADNEYRMDHHIQVPCGGKHERNPAKFKPPFLMANAFHNYKLVWTPFKMVWYIDDIAYRTVYKYYKKTFLGWKGVECSEINLLGKGQVSKSQLFPFYDLDLIINFAFGNGGGFGKEPINPSQFPADFVIDYVRVYQNIGVESIAGRETIWSNQFNNFHIKGSLKKIKNLKWTCSENLYLMEGNQKNVLIGVKNPSEAKGWIKCKFDGKFGPIELIKPINVLNSQSLARSASRSSRIFRFPSFN